MPAGPSGISAVTPAVPPKSDSGADGPSVTPDAPVGTPDAPTGSDAGGDGDAALPEVPTTCAEASQSAGYVGCDFWATVTPHPVFAIFDFAVAVANPGNVTATVSVTGPGLGAPATVQVPR